MESNSPVLPTVVIDSTSEIIDTEAIDNDQVPTFVQSANAVWKTFLS